MKKAKRALALALVFALVASFCVTGAAADGGQTGQTPDIVYGSYDGNVWSQTADGDGSYTDSTSGVTVSKTATATGTENQYKVTLKVEVPVKTSTKSDSAATVLVIDVSNSMDYCDQCGEKSWHKDDCGYNGSGHYDEYVKPDQTRLHAAKEAAEEFVNGYRDKENNTPRYVAIVSFGQYGHNVSRYWYDVSTGDGYEDAIDAIDGLDTPRDDNGGTNLDAGLSTAEELFKWSDYLEIIDDVPQENRFAIALTDGRPTFSEHRGDGTSCNQKILDDTKETANDLKKEAKLYTVCFGAADEVCWEGGYQEDVPTVGEFLENSIASKGCAYEASDGDALSNIFNQLTEDIEDSLERLTVTDPMADGVMLNTDFTDDSVSVVNDDTITWGLNNGERDGNTITYTLTYTVTVDPAAFKDQKAGYYPLNGRTFLTIPVQDGGDTESTVQFPVPGVFVTPTVTENTSSITIEVYVDGTKVTLTDDTHLKNYISNLTDDAGTPTFEYNVEDGVIKGTYNYEQFDSADIVLTPNGNYVLQGIYGTFIQGQDSWQGINEDEEQAGVWTIDNVQGDSVLKVYLNTKYSVEYEVTGSETIDAPTDDAVYVTGAGVMSDNSNDPVTGQNGEQRSWKNDGLNTSITIKPLPTGTTGWTDEATPTGTHDKDDEIGVATAVTGGLDADGDHTFTFTATANEYTVTYNDGVDGAEVFADQTYENLTYGQDTPAFVGTPEREGYTFAGWLPEVAATVTGDATYTATWTADENTAYKVEYYLENLTDDGFTKYEEATETKYGTTGATATLTQDDYKTFEGFTFDADNESNVTEGTIAGDGSLVLKLYYVRDTYTVTYDANAEDATGSVTDDNTYKYGATVTVLENGFTYAGHTFTGWNTQKDGSGPTYQPNETFKIEENTTLYAQWKEITGTLTVTKTFSGLDEGVLPSDFSITVTGPDGSSQTLTLDGTTPVNGVYTWEIKDAPYGEYTITEKNTTVYGYTLQESSVTTAEAEINDESGDTAELRNVYVKDNPGLGVVKTVYSVNGDTENIPEMVEVGDVIVYQIVVKNTGNVRLTNISVTDTLGESELTLYTDAACTETASTTISSLAAYGQEGDSETFYAKYEVTAADAEAGFVKNTATASDGDTTGEGDITVDVKKQYTLTVKYYYDEASGEPFKTKEDTLNEGDSWSVVVGNDTTGTHIAPASVENGEVTYIFDSSLPAEH